MFYAVTLSVFAPWKKYLHKNKSEFNIQYNGLQCTSVQAAVKAPPGRMQLYSRHSINYSYWNFGGGSKHILSKYFTFINYKLCLKSTLDQTL